MQKSEVGQLLRAARERAGLTQRQIADLLDVRQTTVSAWETAVSEPNLETIYRWAAACGERAVLTVARPGAADPLSPLVEVARALPSADLDRLLRVARALPQLGARTADVLVAAIEGAAEDARQRG